MSNQQNYLTDVKEQYEDLPYPPRNPQDEKNRLMHTILECLEMINHIGFKGEQTFKKGFRCLVAGGGTGDSTIFLADQLKNFSGAEVVQVDLSEASLNVCKERAKIRGLTNIKWIQGSLLDVENMDIGTFDYINCSGVLHHLSSPTDGMNALKSVLKNDGVMLIMVYGAYGRLQIYPMQEAMRCVNENAQNKDEELDNTKKILQGLPANHFMNINDLVNSEYKLLGDSGLYDLLLHSQDKAYTVPQIYEWVKDCDLNILTFFNEQKKFLAYKAEHFIRDTELLAKVKKLSLEKQQTIAEVLNGLLYMHVFSVSKKPVEQHMASINNKKLVPFFLLTDENPNLLVAQNMQASLDKGVMVITQNTLQTIIPATKEGVEILKFINGDNSIEEILKKSEKKIKKLGINTSANKIKSTFETIFNRLHETGNMWLRDKSVEKFR